MNNEPFTHAWVLNLIQANGGQINANVIASIMRRFPNMSLRDIIQAHRWLIPLIRPNPNNVPLAVRNQMGITPDGAGKRRDDEIYEEEDVTHGLRPYYKGPMVRLEDIPYIRRPSGPEDDGAGGVGSGIRKSHSKNKWISHVKAYAAKHNVPYHIALKEAAHTYK